MDELSPFHVYCAIFTFLLSAILYATRRLLKGEIYTKPTSIKGQIAIVTGGGLEGIGRATAIDLAQRGAKVYVTCAAEEAGMASVRVIKRRHKNCDVNYLQLDLSSLESIRRFAREFRAGEERLDILVCGEKRTLVGHSVTEDGFETHFGVNYLGHFLLVNLLLDLLKKSAPSRVIVVSSYLHYLGSLDRDKMIRSRYSRLRAYADAELAKNLFVHEFNRRMKEKNVTINSLDPGVVVKRLSDSWLFRFLIEMPLKLFFKSSREGAQTSVQLAIDPDLRGVSGKFYSNCEVTRRSEKSHNDKLAAWLWTRSEDLVGLTSV